MEPAPAQAVGTQGDANPDLDAQTMVINSLRTQINDLYSQVTQLNGQLVKSYNRVSDLEDDLHITSNNLRSSTLKISELEMERTQHLAALNTGLLVEKSQVTTELNRLMEQATEEAAQRGQAESARLKIEKELDDLAATLFEKANNMVAEARFAQSQSEHKVDVAQQALKGAEEAVSMMQAQMQDLIAQKEEAERNAESARSIMEKGKWVDKSLNEDPAVTRRLINSHLPYQEFILFISHLRSVHASATPSPPPAVSTLLALPFLSRLVAEDVEPTVRLDLAPSLNWLSRRSVLTAIHHGQLIIEPMSSQNLLLEHSQSQAPLPGFNSSTNTVCCALCGASMFVLPDGRQRSLGHTLASLSLSRTPSSMGGGAWFKKPLSTSTQPSPPSTPPLHKSPEFDDIPSQVYVFRLSPSNATHVNGTIVSAPSAFSHTSSPSTSVVATSIPAQPPQTQVKPSSIYPLCADGWCLTRLRTTCSLWAFVRTGIVEKIWEEEIPRPPSPQLAAHGVKPTTNGSTPTTSEKPKRRGLWGMASALTERASSWTGESDREKKEEKKLPPPPIHAPSPQKTGTDPLPQSPPPLPGRSANRENTPVAPRFVAPPLEDRHVQKENNVEATQVSSQSNAPELIQEIQEATQDVVAPPLPARAEVLPEPTSPDPARSPKSPRSPEPPRSPALVSSPKPRPLSSTVLESEAAKVNESNGHSSPRIRSRPTSGVISEAPLRAKTPPPRPPPRAPRPMSPRAIPLPDSRPSTPLQSQLPASDTVENAPPRSGSPAPPSGGPPPPVPPRRPARRARPISANVAPPSRPATPVQVAGPAESAVIDKPSQNDTTQSPEAAPPKNDETSVAEEKKEDAKVEEVAAETINTQPSLPTSPEPPSRNIGGGEEEAESVPAVNTTYELSSKTTQEQTSDKRQAEEAPPAGEEDIQGAYIGNTKWEERTWKEVVRLRQEMFWARTGCIYV